MLPGLILKRGRLTRSLRAAFAEYYRSRFINAYNLNDRWRMWEAEGTITTYRAVTAAGTVGWIIYNATRSTIEEILANEKSVPGAIESLMVDALIARESLVSAEILEEDEGKFRWMIDYGFRPTRSFSAGGLCLTKMDLSTSILFKKLKMRMPAKAYKKKERVVIVRIPPTRTSQEIKASLTSLIDALGGIGCFVRKGQTVAIKPNVVAEHGLKDGRYTGGIVTDIGLLRALIEILLPIAGKVIIAEGSSINRSETAKLFSHYGYDRLVDIDPAKVSLVDLNTDRTVEKTVPGGKRMISRKIPLTIEQADAIINVPVMKTHFAAVVSLAIKNLQGILPPLEKYMTHFFGLWQNLINIHRLVKPKLTIVDGLTAQEGFGPVYGIPKTMNLLIAGTNPVAVDATAMRIMGFNPLISPPVRMAYLQGLGPLEQDKIDISGIPLDQAVSPFRQPKIDISGGRDFIVHGESACQGCAGYLHFVIAKLRKPDPNNPDSFLIDRPFEKRVHVFLGPETDQEPDPGETNIFMGICQQHHKGSGMHLPGCPPHAEVIMKGIFSLFPDMKRPQYADKSAEDKLEEMLEEVLRNIRF